MNWNDRNVRDSYEENIKVGLHNVMNFNFNGITDNNIADNVINVFLFVGFEIFQFYLTLVVCGHICT